MCGVKENSRLSKDGVFSLAMSCCKRAHELAELLEQKSIDDACSSGGSDRRQAEEMAAVSDSISGQSEWEYC